MKNILIFLKIFATYYIWGFYFVISETPLDHASDWICQLCSQKYIVTEIYDMESRAKLKMADMEKNGKT